MAKKSLKSALASIATKTNADFWDLARRFSPSFKSHTAEATATEFSEKGFEAITLSGTQVLNEFFEISMRVAFQLLNVSRAKNPLIDKGIIQVYDTPNGGYVQRMAVHSIKPISPKFKNLKDGDSIDPFVVRKPKIDERFFDMNFDYQNLVTVQEYQLKTMFINEYGMGELLAGVLEGLANGYTIQEYLNAKECINAAINSTSNPLRETQELNLTGGWNSTPTEAQLKELILAIKDTATRMTTVPQTGMYNALGFESVVDPEDHVLLMRAGIKNAMNTELMVGAFNPDFLTLPFEVAEIDDFGGLVPYQTVNNVDVELKPVYDALGEQVGFIDKTAVVAGAAEFRSNKWQVPTTVEGATVWVDAVEPDGYTDPNADILAVLIQKGAIFETAQNPYQVTPIYNPRGLYTNYIASRPNTGIHYDALYNMVVFKKGGSASVVPVKVEVVNTADSPVLTQEVTVTP